MEMWVIWIIAAVVFGIIELSTTSFFIIWFSIGSICAAVTSVYTNIIYFQIFIFLLVSTVLLAYTRPIVKKFMDSKQPHKTNVDNMIGQKGIVTADINPLVAKGQIKVKGEYWTANSADQSVIEKDTVVVVKEIKGVTAIVSKLEE